MPRVQLPESVTVQEASSASQHSQDWGSPMSNWGSLGYIGQLEEKHQDMGHQRISKPSYASVSSFIYL